MSTTPAADITMEDLLAIVVEEGASDLHIEVGSPPADQGIALQTQRLGVGDRSHRFR
jgi:Tfp pilus assembly pilus retraction ATPase PilT